MNTQHTEPARLSDEELMELMPQQFRDDLATVSRMAAHGAGSDVGPGLFRVSLNTGALEFARAVEAATLARAQRQPVPPEPGEVQELVEWLIDNAKDEREMSNGANPASMNLDRAAELLSQRHPRPVPVSERWPGHIEQALIKAECALADIAEGEAEDSDGDPLEWAEKRAADALARIRPVMRQHQIQTSEWPPVPAHDLPLPGEVEA